MPDPMTYTNSGIVCLANDLRENAEALQNKRVAAGDRTKTINDVRQIAAQVTYYPSLPGWTWYSNSRLIILGHGNPESTHIMGEGIQWDAQELARRVASWLDNSIIARISLHMCYGGGNRGAASGANFGAFGVHPSNSFAYRFASHCSVARSVTARTDTTRMRVTTRGDEFVNAIRLVGDRHKGAGDKVIFWTQGGTVNNPVNPRMTFVG